MEYITIYHVLSLGTIIFFIGMLGITLCNTSMLLMIINLEMSFLGINIVFISYAAFIDQSHGAIYAIMVMVVTAAEVALALSLLAVHYKNNKSIAIDTMTILNDRQT